MNAILVSALSISIVQPGERAAVEAMLQLYIHDFSELFAGTRRGDLGEDGRYVVDIAIRDWWSDTVDHVALLIRVDGRLAGFALLNRKAHGDHLIDWAMAEFFVVRKYRRAGVGRLATREIFARYPGRWEAAVMRLNTGALAFWDAAIRSHPAVAAIEIFDTRPPSWNGSSFVFSIVPSIVEQ